MLTIPYKAPNTVMIGPQVRAAKPDRELWLGHWALCPNPSSAHTSLRLEGQRLRCGCFGSVQSIDDKISNDIDEYRRQYVPSLFRRERQVYTELFVSMLMSF